MATSALASFFTSSKHTVRREVTGDNSANPYADVQFSVIYRFPYITAARWISRMKLYQTAFAVLAVPLTVYYYNIGEVGFESCTAVFAISTLALTMLYIAAYFFQRVVGLVAVSGDEQVVRLSHLTFFGGRNDVFAPVDDIVPLNDISENSNDVFVKVRRYSTTDTLYMSLLYGHIESARSFQRVFGII